MTIKIRETIHHGDYYNVRDVELSKWDYQVFMREVMGTSPYNSGKENVWTANCYEKVRDTGEGHYGWGTYEVITD